jgi:preprotein translocase subunit SecF
MKLYPLRLVPENISIDFMKMRKINYIISVALSIISIIWVCIFGFNFGIDFAGGISIEARINQEPDIGHIREVLTKLDVGEVMINTFGNENDISIRIGNFHEEKDLTQKVAKVKDALKNNFKYEIDYRDVSFVGPQVGKELIKSGTYAMILSFAAIMIYVWIRFEWQFGLGVLIALVHDGILSLGFMSFTQIDFNLSTIAALLTIIAFSVNDSVVIYDRIRENLRKYVSRPMCSIINTSINETLSRTTLTVLTILLTNASLIIFGGEAIRSFSVLVFFGIMFGTYSSIFISAPILTLFKFEKEK